MSKEELSKSKSFFKMKKLSFCDCVRCTIPVDDCDILVKEKGELQDLLESRLYHSSWI